jgi:AcrR family transcriptional regulator
MQVPDRAGSTVTNRARRDQIVAATVEVIAASGYRAAAFQSIARQAGIKSTRTISYHFANKDELIQAVVQHVMTTIGESLKDVESGGTATESLASYIRSTVALSRDHRKEMTALMNIFLEHHPDDDTEVYGDANEEAVTSRVEQILIAGQESGEFGEFDTEVMAMTIQRAVDGMPFLLRSRPDLDLDHYADELVALFRRATAADQGGGR